MWKLLSLILFFICIGCGAKPQHGADTQTPDVVPSSSPVADVTPTPSPSAQPGDTLTVTLYSLTKVIDTAFVGGNSFTVNGTGYCIYFQSKYYCWDDGQHTLLGNPFQFWGIDNNVEACPNFHGFCQSDLLQQPAEMTQDILNALNTVVGSGHRSIQMVLNGQQTQFQCTFDGSILDCSNFQVNVQ